MPSEVAWGRSRALGLRWTIRVVLESREGKARAVRGDVKLVGAIYDLVTGRVRFLQ